MLLHIQQDSPRDQTDDLADHLRVLIGNIQAAASLILGIVIQTEVTDALVITDVWNFR